MFHLDLSLQWVLGQVLGEAPEDARVSAAWSRTMPSTTRVRVQPAREDGGLRLHGRQKPAQGWSEQAVQRKQRLECCLGGELEKTPSQLKRTGFSAIWRTNARTSHQSHSSTHTCHTPGCWSRTCSANCWTTMYTAAGFVSKSRSVEEASRTASLPLSISTQRDVMC